MLSQQLLRPVRPTGPLRWWSINLAPQTEDAREQQTTTKTGVIDDIINLDHPAWLGPAFAKWIGHREPKEKIFKFSADDSVRLFRKAAESLGLPPLCLYQLRHGGASEEVVQGVGPMEAIKVRGRWKSDCSIRRYAKPATLWRLLASVSEHKLAACRLAVERLAGILEGRCASPI